MEEVVDMFLEKMELAEHQIIYHYCPAKGREITSKTLFSYALDILARCSQRSASI
ncbi:hypothetical protein [Desulfovibrio sp. ZJ200]|uniref:hypothetical protein n=1 Tax=Desulfovibrio sp. ZJ200 TaxID=2709792 RepID=UPI0019826D53|nr:hypothetical protein [Desulfovibrio sp. ZJ200]